MTLELKEDFADGIIRHGPANMHRALNADTVAVGDLNSDAKGSGARKNAGKPQLDLIPVWIWANIWANRYASNYSRSVSAIMSALINWQSGNTDALLDWLSLEAKGEMVSEGVAVLEFGIQKYKAWNWAKGMQWSVCTGCILRHIEKILQGEETDPDSQRKHWGHIVANVVFLIHYKDTYPEGDDRPPQYPTTS